MPPEPGHRASDADREAVSAVIRDAAGDGRLGLDEVDERLDAVWKARTYGELALVTDDLPVPAALLDRGTPTAVVTPVRAGTAEPERTPVVPGATRERGAAVAVFGEHRRTGAWRVPAQLTAVALFGSVDLDLRRATLTARETVIHVFAMFGGIEITVPDDVEVHVTGVGIMGGYQGPPDGGERPGAPVVRVVGAAVMGGVEVRRRPRSGGRPGSRALGRTAGEDDRDRDRDGDRELGAGPGAADRGVDRLGRTDDRTDDRVGDRWDEPRDRHRSHHHPHDHDRDRRDRDQDRDRDGDRRDRDRDARDLDRRRDQRDED